MTGYTNTNSTGNQVPTGAAGSHPVQSDPVAAQGGYLGKAQGWATRVTGNLQGQAEQLKGKFGGPQGAQGTAVGQQPTGTGPGYSPTGTGAGYGATNTGAGYGTQGHAGYNDPNSGHSNQAQPGYNTQPTGHGYAPAQAKTGSATDGTYGSNAAKPSYTDQAKQWTARAADNLHGQAEYLKGKMVGTSGTGAPTPQTAGGQTGSGFSQGSGTGYGQSSDMHRSGEPAMHTGDATTGTAAPQAKKSWTESAKQGLASGLTHTQQGLEVVKNKVGGPTSTSGPGTTGSTYSTGHPSTGTAGTGTTGTGYTGTGYDAGTNPNQKY